MLIQGNQSSLLSSEQYKGKGFDLLPLQLYVCFGFVLICLSTWENSSQRQAAAWFCCHFFVLLISIAAGVE